MQVIMSVVGLMVTTAVFADQDFLAEMLQGNYLLLGKSIDSNQTYLGKVEIFSENNQLHIKRNIDNADVFGRAAIESALNGNSKVLRIRFNDDEKQYEETCLFSLDLDNYPRITCYLYQPGITTSDPGLEVLFHDHRMK